MVPQLIAPRSSVPPWPTFAVTTETPYEWLSEGRVIQRTGLVAGNPTIIRAVLCGSPCRTGGAPGLRTCGQPGGGIPGVCAVLYGGPFPLSDFPKAEGIARNYAKTLVTSDFQGNDPNIRIDSWIVRSTEKLPLLFEGFGSPRWPHRDFRWWWGAIDEEPYGRRRVLMHDRQVRAGGVNVGSYWEAEVLVV